ncbi:MAG: hypothetical protein C0604_09590 [Clostridiales bacterium]|nr:MAG: hypothetical protein C0604_09590 [Clostridiales bacterium]
MKKANIFIAVLLVLSLFMNYRTASEIEQLKNRVSNMHNDLSRDISNISNSVYRAADEMKKQALWVRESSIVVTESNENYTNFQAELTFTLNEKKNGEELSIIAVSEGDSRRIEVPEREGLTYEAQLELEDENYTFELVGTDEEGSRNVELTGLSLNGIANRMIDIDGMIPSSKFSHDPDIGKINFYVNVSTVHPKVMRELSGIAKEIAFESIEADVYTGTVKVGTIDLMNGTGYETKEIEEITDETPATLEFSGQSGEIKTYQFAGTYTLDGKACSDYLESQDSSEPFAWRENEIVFMVRATDKEGNVYKGLFPGHFHYLDGDEIVFMK